MSVSGILPAGSPAEGRRLVALALCGAAFVAGVAILFAVRFHELYSGWKTDDNYSHGFLVPIVSAWLAWGVLRRQGWSDAGNLRSGLLWVGLGCALHLWADVIWWPPIDFLALTTLLYGLAVLAGGRRWAQGFLFPILFLFFMFPLSPVLLARAAGWLQEIVATTATWLLQIFVPAYKQGSRIILPGQPLEVGEQCSGLRQIVAFAALALLVAYLSPRRWPFRIGIFLACVPIAIAANLLRVLLMAFLTMQFGPESISETRILAFGVSYHTAWGLLTMAAGLVLLLGVAWWLGRVFPSAEAEDAGAAGGASRPPPDLRVLPAGLTGRLAGGVAGVAIALLAQLGLQAHLAAADERMAPANFMKQPLQMQGDQGFPMSLGPWLGKDTIPEGFSLPYFNSADDRVNRSYVLKDTEGRDQGLVCHLFMVHFRNGQDRLHHPRICYLMTGCTEEPRGHETVPMAGAGQTAQRFCFTKGNEAGYLSYVYYWHYTFEPDVAGLSWLQRVRAEWAVRPSLTVEVFTSARTPDQLNQSADFVRLVDQQLQAYLPPGAQGKRDAPHHRETITTAHDEVPGRAGRRSPPRPHRPPAPLSEPLWSLHP